MASSNISNVINGELRAGDVVVSFNASEYSYLAGIVRDIVKHDTPEHTTGNAGDDVYVDFSALEYTPRKVSEIEDAFRDAYGEERDFDDCPLDEVIMHPDMLLRANNADLINRGEMDNILNSDEGAMAYCYRVFTAFGADTDRIGIDFKKAAAFDAQAEFSHRFGTEMPEVIAGLRMRLIEIADQNWHDYRHSERSTTPDNVYHVAVAVVAHRNACEFLKEYKDFTSEQLNCLLQFADPVDLVADYLSPDSDISEMQGILPNILENQDRYKGLYALADTEPAEPPLMTSTLYSPVFCNLWELPNTHLAPISLNQEEAAAHIEDIRILIIAEGEAEGFKSGLMAFYNETDSVSEKVRSLNVDVETHGGKLWAVSTLEVTEPLTAEELSALRGYMADQFSDGWGSGFAQHNIRTESGDINVHFWKYGDEFFIDTQEQFSQRLGIDLPADALSQPAPSLTPAQKALDEPDMFDSEDVAALRERLIERLNGNLGEYFGTLQGMDGKEIASFSSEIAVMTEAHYYLTEMHNFHTSELEYLMQFKNPLQVVSDAFEAEGLDNSRSDVMWKVFDRQDALQGDYALISDAPAPDVEDLEQRLQERLADNYAAYKRDTLDLSKEEIFSSASEIVSVSESFEYFSEEHYFDESEVEFLLKFQNPLELISDKWNVGLRDISHMIRDIFDNQERTLSNGGYELASDDPETPPTTVATQVKSNTPVSTGEKPSVMDEIRQAQRDMRERTALPKEKSPQDLAARKKSEPDL